MKVEIGNNEFVKRSNRNDDVKKKYNTLIINNEKEII
jgi:hypothetical protein